MAKKDKSDLTDWTSIIAGGGIDIVLGLLSGMGEAEIARLDREQKYKIAADQLGLDYKKLSEDSRQFNEGLRVRTDEFSKTYKLDKRKLQASIAQATEETKLKREELAQTESQFGRTLGQRKEEADTDKAFGLSDRYAKMGEQKATTARKSAIASQFGSPAPANRPTGAPTMAVTPTAGAPSPTLDMGAQALAGQQAKTKTGSFPLSGGF